MQSQEKFSAGHIFKPATGLNPVPFLTKDSWDMGSTFIPMFMNDSLDKFVGILGALGKK